MNLEHSALTHDAYYDDLARAGVMLGDASRQAVLGVLYDQSGSQSFAELVSLTGLRPSTLQRELVVLAEVGVVSVDRRGNWQVRLRRRRYRQLAEAMQELLAA